MRTLYSIEAGGLRFDSSVFELLNENPRIFDLSGL
jgi:hypothetical protein